MSNPIENHSIIDQFDVIDFCRICNGAVEIDEIVAHTADIAARRAGIDAIAIVLSGLRAEENIIVASRAPLSAIARQGIKAYGMHLFNGLNGLDEQCIDVPLRQVGPGANNGDIAPLDVARVVLSIDFGPAEKPIGSIAFFSHRHSGIGARHLRGIEAICPIIEAAVRRVRTISAPSASVGIAALGTISISHVNIIDTVFGHSDAERVVSDVIGLVARRLPPGSRIARLTVDQLGFAIPEGHSVDIGIVAQQIKHDCGHIELTNAMKINVDVVTAKAISASETDIHHAPQGPTAQQGPSLPNRVNSDEALVG